MRILRALQKLSSKSPSRRLGFYDLKTEFRRLLPELFELLKAVAHSGEADR